MCPTKTKWEARRDKPKTLNPSRRRKDFRQQIKQFEKDLVGPPANAKYASPGTTKEGWQQEDRFHDMHYRGPGKAPLFTRIKTVYLDRTLQLISKRNSEDLREIKEFETYVKSVEQKPFEIVTLKITKKYIMQYVKRPSLSALKNYLEGHPAWVPIKEREYCARLAAIAKKSDVSEKALLKNVLACNAVLFKLWKKRSISNRFTFSAANFIVCGTNKQGNLKIAFIDA